MADYRQTQRAAAPLVFAAQEAGLPFEASPTGRYIRLTGEQGVVYVVQDPWGDGCSLLEMGRAEGRHLDHYLSCQIAVEAAAQRVGCAPEPVLVRGRRVGFG